MPTNRKAATREAIANSALALFTDRGYDAVRIEDVARAAGVSRATFYNHFSEREDILRALFERLLADNGAHADRPADLETPLSQIPEVATAAVRRMLTRPDLARFVYRLPFRHESLLKPDDAATPTVFRQIHRLLELAADRGELRTDLPLDLICIHVHGALESAMRAWAEGRTDDPEAQTRTLIELALFGAVVRQP